MTTVGATSPYGDVKPLPLNVSVIKSDLPQPSHHFLAYKALLQSLNRRVDLHRRQQLDSWLKQHQYALVDGEHWELQVLQQSNQTTHKFINWSAEYGEVVASALQSGLFYSDAFQKQLFHCYIETARITLSQQETIHQQVIANMNQGDVTAHRSQHQRHSEITLGLLSVASITFLSINVML